ncbi:MAG: hypothetical protein ACRECA_08620 [Pseudolabrys sp.]
MKPKAADPPIKVAAGAPHHQDDRPTTTYNTSHREETGYLHHSDLTPVQMRARRGGSRRLPVLGSGRSDPWWYEPPIAGYPEAAEHLLAAGLLPAPNIAALQDMWKRGGRSRHVARLIAERWERAA